MNQKTILACIAICCFSISCTRSEKETKVIPEPEGDIYAEHIRSSEYQTPEEEMADFVLPQGFEVTLFASEPMIGKPINMEFDEKGRLWVSQSFEYPFAAEPGKGKDRISVLEDTNGDGKADKITHIAEDLNIPIGLQPVKNGVIAYSIPHVYRFWDDNGDDIAERREVLLGPFEHKDTHGMVNNLFRGFDGWIHASHGFSNVSKVAGKDGDTIKMVSGNTFRFRPDGSRAEKTTDGRINPFGSDYDELGYHYSADCHTMPVYQLIWGGNYTQWGKKTPHMGFAPEMMDYGLNSTALSGLVYYTDDQFPEKYRHSFYSGDVVTCRISRNTMEFQGSTPRATRQEDFLVSKDPWFRPVDIKIGPDGAMYIADFYNRIIGHYEVALDHPGRDRISGRIWKITYKGNQRPITDWSKATKDELLDGLAGPILHQRMIATDELVDRIGKVAVTDLLALANNPSTPPAQRIQVNWALYRLGAMNKDVLFGALGNPDRGVRMHAYRLLAEYPSPDPKLRVKAVTALADPDPHIQRASAEFLSRHPGMDSYQRLVEIHEGIPDYDTHLAYTVKMALFHHLQMPEILKLAVNKPWPKEQETLLALVLSDIPSPQAAGFILAHAKRYESAMERNVGFAEAMARSLPAAKRPELLDWAKGVAKDNRKDTHALAAALDQGFTQGGNQAPTGFETWYKDLAVEILKTSANGNQTEESLKDPLLFATQTAGRFKMADQIPSLTALLTNASNDEDVRAEAAKALMTIAPVNQGKVVGDYFKNVNEAVSFRRKLVAILSIWDNDAARNLLADGLKNSPPELQETIAGSLAKNPKGKTMLMDRIKAGEAPARILLARNVSEAMLNQISPDQKALFESLTANLIPVSEERQQLIDARLARFEPREEMLNSGSKVFQQHCAQCHQIAGKGGLIGPQLDGIGNWGKESLATKILDPNRNITENFRTYHISLKNGQTMTGLFRREQGETTVFADQTGKEFSVAKNEVKEMSPSKSTLMPDNFHAVLTESEFDALLTYLLKTK
jgi:putative heme-binding domain-containing protein